MEKGALMKFLIKEARKKAGMTQQELASVAGVKRETVCGLEKGRFRYPTTRTLEKLATALGTQVRELIAEENA